MALIDQIDSDVHILRARRTAAITRAVLGCNGMLMTMLRPGLIKHPTLGVIGFAVITSTALTQLLAPQMSWLKIEESFAGIAAILIIGIEDQRVTVLSILWLAAVASGVMARGGRVHWIGRSVVLSALALPMILEDKLTADHATLCVASIGLLLTSGRLTRELNHLLGLARDDAESAETLLLAGDIASRVARRSAAAQAQPTGMGATTTAAIATGTAAMSTPETEALSEADERLAREELGRLIAGDGLSMVVQPMVDLRSGAVHAYEALARFGDGASSPLYWLEVAEELGERDALERACLGAALDLFAKRPLNARLSVNLSAPVLLDPRTLEMFGRRRDLHGLIIEITEETLVLCDTQLHAAIAPLQARGACLAVDDMGAGYSGLRQITAVHPRYLKLDRSLVSGIHADADRAALVKALVGYSEHVGSLLVAEGIEEPAELRTLIELGVPLAQGFHLARPAAPWPVVRVDELAFGRPVSLQPELASLAELQLA
ncbi:MAG TPA: EAL domain-containing protein [Solirubrobacteraceae bacterium]|nr:EAL domain-containing protein [Solirubrobacteraceae bacterium]